jgi:hypothetical protein
MANEEVRLVKEDEEDGLNMAMPLQAEPHELPATQRSLYANIEARERMWVNALKHSRRPRI